LLRPTQLLEVDEDLVGVVDIADQTTNYPLPHDELERLVELVDAVETDTKWAACSAILQSHFEGVSTPVVIFSDFVDTTRYISSLLSEVGVPLRAISGSTPIAEREEAIRQLQHEGGVLVLTSAAAEGFVLSTTKLCVHYDLPWSPSVLAQRLGRIHRFGAPPGPVRHVVFADEALTPDSLVRKAFSFELDADESRKADVMSEILRDGGD
jgi:superfamily II DNA/RNA helicase